MVDAPPVALRPTPEGVFMVGTAASPTGDDDVTVDVEVLAGGSLCLRSVAATVVWAGSGSRHRTLLRAGPGATVTWAPEPVVVTAGATHVQTVTVDLAAGATLDWSERVVLGRSGEGPGRADLILDVDVEGRPLLRHHLRVGPGAAGWSGPAVLGAHRAVGLRLLAGPALDPPSLGAGDGWAWCQLDGPGWLLVALGADLPELQARLALAGR